ncbi:hypothetical protein J2W54_004963 [Rhodococcus fascians]|uniref:hypothetical protein n=1 Tax=Nocardiaceae TaxID=85025 RepID=UPI00285BD23F|nr:MULTISPECIES: hypothetical protein [Rhodococcus]MDR6912950.1 hypothetical protein [Rhodococcus sp. 3258]MDR6934547.1 hypothetical protein [Rhodococcus fascians]
MDVNVYRASRDSYNISVGTNHGVVGQGTRSTQTQTNNPALAEVVKAISQIRNAARQIDDDEERSDAERAIADVESAVTQSDPDVATVHGRLRMLRRIGSAIGGAFLTAVTSESTQLAFNSAGFGG